MDIPHIAWSEHGGSLELYRVIYKYSAAFMTDAEIAQITSENEHTIRAYRGKLKKTIVNLPPEEMTTEALYGYLNMSDMIQQDTMQLYLEMREDRDIFRNNLKPNDGKRRLPVQPKDMIALAQTLMKTQLERAAVLTRFAAVSEKKSALPVQSQVIHPSALMSTNEDIIDVDVAKEFSN